MKDREARLQSAPTLLSLRIFAPCEETCGTGVSPVEPRAGRPCHSLAAAEGRARGLRWFCGLGLVVRLASPSPAAPFAFTEEAVNRGINYVVEQTDTFGRGVAVADLDGDGDLDLDSSNWLLPNALMRNDGGCIASVAVKRTIHRFRRGKTVPRPSAAQEKLVCHKMDSCYENRFSTGPPRV